MNRILNYPHTKILVTIGMLEILQFFSWKPTHRGNTVKIKVVQEKKINPTFYLFILDKEDYMEKERLLLIFTGKWFSVAFFFLAIRTKFRKMLTFFVGGIKNNPNQQDQQRRYMCFQVNCNRCFANISNLFVVIPKYDTHRHKFWTKLKKFIKLTGNT